LPITSGLEKSGQAQLDLEEKLKGKNKLRFMQVKYFIAPKAAQRVLRLEENFASLHENNARLNGSRMDD
jgi:hypothetical protein